MAIFSAEITLALPFSRWELFDMVESQGSHEKAVRRGGRSRTLINVRGRRLVWDHLLKRAILETRCLFLAGGARSLRVCAA